MSTILSALTQFGLTPNQTKVYLALLELGEAKVQEIAKKARILRTTTYEVLEQLKSIGLIGMYNRRGVRLYMAEPPQKLETVLVEKQKAIHEVLPELESLYNVPVFKPKIRYYEGLEGYKTVYQDTLTVSNKELCGILSMQDLLDTLGEVYMNEYIKKRVALNIHLKVIRSEAKEVHSDAKDSSVGVKPIWPTSREELRTLRYAPEGFIFPLTMYIYNNKVSLMSSKRENFGLIIESKEFMQTQKAMFNVLWRASYESKIFKGF